LRITRNAVPVARIRGVVAGIAVSLAVSCSAAPAAAHQGSGLVRALPRDPHTATALLKIATVFNDDYDSGVYGPVYDRWDARSKAIISRAEYIRRHSQCPSARVTAKVESARPGPDGAWLVSYAIGGAQLTDYWFYVDGRWLFDLPLSNPSAVSLYKLSGQAYVAALGCAH
jgi:hypothetical protein